MKECISIIVPIYNAEQYLKQWLDSMVKQTLKDIEIILVDDGSKDNSSRLCDEWGEKDSRIKVCHKQNGGASSARNYGLDYATGEYICFVDSDDYLDLDSTGLYEKGVECEPVYNYELLKTEFISELIRNRKEMNISQKQLEVLSNVSQPIIARIENNQTDPQLSTLIKLLEPLGKTLKIVDKLV